MKSLPNLAGWLCLLFGLAKDEQRPGDAGREHKPATGTAQPGKKHNKLQGAYEG